MFVSGVCCSRLSDRFLEISRKIRYENAGKSAFNGNKVFLCHWIAQEIVKLRAFCHSRSVTSPFPISLLTDSLVYIISSGGGWRLAK